MVCKHGETSLTHDDFLARKIRYTRMSLIATLLIMTRRAKAQVNANEAEWKARLRKRISYIELVKESSLYRTPWSASMQEPVPTTPDPYDRKKSKRQWEADTATWRHELRRLSTSRCMQYMVSGVLCCSSGGPRWGSGGASSLGGSPVAIVRAPLVFWWCPWSFGGSYCPRGFRGTTRIPVGLRGHKSYCSWTRTMSSSCKFQKFKHSIPPIFGPRTNAANTPDPLPCTPVDHRRPTVATGGPPRPLSRNSLS